MVTQSYQNPLGLVLELLVAGLQRQRVTLGPSIAGLETLTLGFQCGPRGTKRFFFLLTLNRFFYVLWSMRNVQRSFQLRNPRQPSHSADNLGRMDSNGSIQCGSFHQVFEGRAEGSFPDQTSIQDMFDEEGNVRGGTAQQGWTTFRMRTFLYARPTFHHLVVVAYNVSPHRFLLDVSTSSDVFIL